MQLPMNWFRSPAESFPPRPVPFRSAPELPNRASALSVNTCLLHLVSCRRRRLRNVISASTPTASPSTVHHPLRLDNLCSPRQLLPLPHPASSSSVSISHLTSMPSHLRHPFQSLSFSLVTYCYHSPLLLACPCHFFPQLHSASSAFPLSFSSIPRPAFTVTPYRRMSHLCRVQCIRPMSHLSRGSIRCLLDHALQS